MSQATFDGTGVGGGGIGVGAGVGNGVGGSVAGEGGRVATDLIVVADFVVVCVVVGLVVALWEV